MANHNITKIPQIPQKIYTKDDLPKVWPTLSHVAAITLAYTISLPLNQFELLEVTDQAALVKFTPVSKRDPVLPLLTIPTGDDYKTAITAFADHLMDFWSYRDRAGYRRWFLAGKALISDVVSSLPEQATYQTRLYITSHLADQLVFVTREAK